MAETPDVAPDVAPRSPATKVAIDPRVALGVGLGCMVVGMFVMWKITSKRPCKGCQETQFVQVPQFVPTQVPPPPQRPAPVAPAQFPDPTSHPETLNGGGYVPGTLVNNKYGEGPGPKLADPPPGFQPPAAPVSEGGLRFA